MQDWTKAYHRFGVVEVDELLPRLRENLGGRLRLFDQEVNVKSLRLELFCTRPLVCVACGLVATHWAVEVPPRLLGKQRPHLNLYGYAADGTEEQLTQDHIVAKVDGGKDYLRNLQVMCSSCNQQKGPPVCHASKV